MQRDQTLPFPHPCPTAPPVSYTHLGIALPGNYNHNTGVVEYISTMHDWDGFAIQAAFQDAIPDVPVFFQNAGRAGAKGEIDFGAAALEADMAYVHGAMGLTLSMYSSQGIHVGDKGFTGRFGHIIIDVNGRPCPVSYTHLENSPSIWTAYSRKRLPASVRTRRRETRSNKGTP